jgi:di/tricarboxylate transporter
VVDAAGRLILRHTGTKLTPLLCVIVLASATLGAFMSNTASTAFFVPLVFGIARRAKVSAAKLLMPLAFSSIVTSSVSLISTSTNVVVSGLMKQNGMEPMGMFELAPVGIPIAVVGILYILTLGRKLVPDRFSSADVADNPLITRPYLFELFIHSDSPLVGKNTRRIGSRARSRSDGRQDCAEQDRLASTAWQLCAAGGGCAHRRRRHRGDCAHQRYSRHRH